MLLEVENSFDGVVEWEEGGQVPVTRKQETGSFVSSAGEWEKNSQVSAAKKQRNLLGCMEHGIGLKNVREIAERYLGVMDIKINGNVFQVTVMLQRESNEV